MASENSGDCGCSCGSNGKSTIVLACSGASNVGQLTNDLALRMTREGLGKMSCLAGVGAHLSGFVVSACDCDRLIVLDGCPQKCAAKTLEHVGVEPHVYLLFTEHGFEKRHDVPVQPEEVERARDLVIERLAELDAQ